MRKHLSEPWFSLVCTGQKVFEGRLANNTDFANACVGTLVTWFNTDLPFERTCCVKITSKNIYPTFQDMLADKGMHRVLPTVPSIQQGVQVYRMFYPRAKETRFGVICLRMKVISC